MINKSDLNKFAVITADKKITYSEFLLRMNQYAEVYANLNYKRIAIFADNSSEWLYAFYSGWLNSCVVLPIDSMSSKDDVRYILEDCQPDLLFISDEKKSMINEILPELNFDLDIQVFSDVDTQKKIETLSDIEYNTEDTAVIIYTSGTTGSPKGVMLSFENLLINIKGVSHYAPIYTPEMEVMIFLPLHHVFPLVGSLVAPLYIGATVVMSPSMQSSDILNTLQNNKIKLIIAVPRFYEILYKGIKDKIDAKGITRLLYKLCHKIGNRNLTKKIFNKVHQNFGGHLQYMIAGGAALSEEVCDFFYTLGFDILQGFGMTEAAPMIAFTRPDNIVVGSVGPALPECFIDIKDGEIVAKGANVMQGYYNRPEETAAVLKEGWLHTGDLGRIDENGLLWITGRKKEIIIFPNGKNLNPIEKISKKIKEIRPNLFLLVGKAENNTAELVITPDGEIKNIVFIEELVNSAPEIKNWKFTALKPAQPEENFGINIGEIDFNAENIFFYANDYPAYPDEISLSIIHKDYKAEDHDVFLNGCILYIENGLGELNSLEKIDEMQVISEGDAEKELIPISKLSEYLNYRQAEFIEKYDNIFHNSEEDEYYSVQGTIGEEEKPLIALINASMFDWESKASHPWILTLQFAYPPLLNGVPNQESYAQMKAIENIVSDSLLVKDGYIMLGSEMADGIRKIFIACKEYRESSKIVDKILSENQLDFAVDYYFFKDKYWRLIDKYKPSF